MRVRGGPCLIGPGVGVVLALLLGGAAPASAQLVADQPQVFFGHFMLGQTGPLQPVILRNLGIVPVRIQGISIDGSHSTDFVLSPHTCPQTLGFGAACLVQLRFSPTQSGVRQAALRVDGTGPGTPLLVPLFGMGLPQAPLLSLFPTGFIFPDQPLGTPSGNLIVTLSNVGLADLHVSSIVMAGPHALDFHKSAACDQAVIPPGGQCALTVVFSPTTFGDRSATLVITSDSGGLFGMPHQIPLTGRATEPAITFNPSPLNFGTRLVGTPGSGARTLLITNTGNATLFVTGLSLSGGQAGDFSIPSTISCTAPPGQACSVSLGFVPTGFGTRATELVVTSNVPGPAARVGLTGFGDYPPTPAASFTDDHRFLSTGSTLTPICTVAGGAATTLTVPVTRVVGPIPAGSPLTGAPLTAPGPLVGVGALSPTATLEIMAYNVTAGSGQALPRVIFNGADRGALTTGTAGSWSLTTLAVPIGTLNFPAPRAGGPSPALNTLRLNVTAPGPGRCTALAWVRLSFLSLSPVILVHGDGSNGAFYVRRGFAGALDAIGIPNDRSINLAGGGSATIAANAFALQGLLPGIATRFGVNSVHVVAHSKGGLDMRAWLGTFGTANGFRVLSLTTLATPHRGSALADAKLAVASSWVVLPGVPTAVFAAFGFPGASAFDLSTFSTAFFNPPLPAAADYRMIGGDTDRFPDTLILRVPVDEYAAARAEVGITTGTVLTDALATTAYQFMRNTRTVIVVPAVIPVPFFPFFLPAMVPAPLPNFVPMPNDLLVNLASALGGPPPLVPAAVFIGATPPTNSRNHADIADAGVAGVVLPLLVTTDLARGDLR